MRGLFHILWLSTVLLLPSSGAFGVAHPNPLQGSPVNRRLETLSLCELTQHWQQHDHQVVRVVAIYREGAETAELYDPECPSRGDRTAWVNQGPPYPLAPELQKRLTVLLKKDGRVRITAVGKFDGPKPVDVPPDTPPGIADVMRGLNSRYGHMNHWDFQFTFSNIETIDAVPSGEVWPQWPKAASTTP
jgi:hypothetical protein